MPWFGVSLMYEAVHDGVTDLRPLWEEQIVLVSAADAASAEAAGAAIGRRNEHEYYVDSPTRHLLRWRFVAVERAYALIDALELKDGVEVFSRFITEAEGRSLLTAFDEDAS